MQSFTANILNKKNSNEILVKKIIALCFDIYKVNLGFKSVFDTMVSLASLNYPKYLSAKSECLIKYFLSSSEIVAEYSYQLYNTFPFVDLNVFAKYSNEVFEKVINESYETVNNKNILLFNVIASCVPEFFFVRQIDGDMRIVTWMNLIFNTNDAYFINSFLNLMKIAIERIEASKNLKDADLQEIFKSRKKFFKVILVDENISEFDFEASQVNGGVRMTDLMHCICNLYYFIYSFSNSNEMKMTMLDELIGFYKVIRNDECIYIFNTLKKIAGNSEEGPLLRNFSKMLKAIRKYESIAQIKDQVKVIYEIINDLPLEGSRASSASSISIKLLETNVKKKQSKSLFIDKRDY